MPYLDNVVHNARFLLAILLLDIINRITLCANIGTLCAFNITSININQFPEINRKTQSSTGMGIPVTCRKSMSYLFRVRTFSHRHDNSSFFRWMRFSYSNVGIPFRKLLQSLICASKNNSYWKIFLSVFIISHHFIFTYHISIYT